MTINCHFFFQNRENFGKNITIDCHISGEKIYYHISTENDNIHFRENVIRGASASERSVGPRITFSEEMYIIIFVEM